MSTIFAETFSGLIGLNEIRVLMVGLRDAGKTTILYKIKFNEIITTVPVTGVVVESCEYRNINFTVWDVGLGGQDESNPSWEALLQTTQGLIFVVDSSDTEKLSDAKDELWRMIKEDEMRNANLLVFANKQDLSNAVSVAAITEKLGLDVLRNHKWYIQPSCAITGEGLYEGFDWLAKTLK